MRVLGRAGLKGALKASVAGAVVAATSGAAWAATTDTSAVAGLDEITVVGTRLTQTSADRPASVTILSREKIDQLGVTTVGDALRYVPQQSFSNNQNTTGGIQGVQLRGLGVGTTLVLVNGRRAVPGALGGRSNGFFDLNSIPLAAVERIEVLANSGSAVYGADAVGGVINIVLKSDIAKPVLDLYYGDADGGADERRASVSLGGHSDRAHGLVVLDYFRRGALPGAERSIIANEDYRRFPGGVDLRTQFNNPGNICAAKGNLPGLSTPCAAVPAGSSGAGLTPSSFLATAGQANLNSWRATASPISPLETYSVSANGGYDLTSGVEAFTELGYSEAVYRLIIGAQNIISNGAVPANNPFNPFGVPVTVNYALGGPLPADTYHERDYREVAGLRGRVHDWSWELSFNGSQGTGSQHQQNYIDNTKTAAALAATSPDQALNVFKDGPGGSSALLSSLLIPYNLRTAFSASAYQVSAFTRGNLVRLPAGPLRVVVGGEWRNESLASFTPPALPSNYSGERKSYAGYVESKIPILGSATGLPIVHDLTATIAGRYDHYDGFGGTFNPQYAADWKPASWLLIHGAYGNSYRAPNLSALYSVALTQSATVGDPRRNNQLTPVTLLSGGNRDLHPETSTTSNFGAVWTPDLPGRPRFGVNFWRIDQENRIVGGATLPIILANEPTLPSGVIVRATPTPADAAAGQPGQLISVSLKSVNLGSLSTQGVDLEASATFKSDFGQFTPSLAVTYVEEYKSQDFSTSPIVNRVGVANVSGTVPRWKAVASLSWERNGVGVTAATRSVAAYKDATTANVINGLTVKGQTLVDLQARANLGEIMGRRAGIAKGFVIKVGATNLFDQGPGYSQITSTGYDPTQADIRQRFIYVGLSKSF